MTTLDSLSVGGEATIVDVGGARPLQRRLMEFGILPGTRVRLVRRHALQGIVELEVRDSHLTLRAHEAGRLSVDRG
ncbi:MAG: ferrous iron transport protein A [Planctomycetota bacterium JB042]